MAIVYYVVRHLLPKRWRANDAMIKRWVRAASTITGNIAKKDDSIGEVLKKSHTIFEYFWDSTSSTKFNAVNEFKLIVRDLPEETDVHKDETFMRMIFPKLEPLGETKMIYEIDANHLIFEHTFTMPEDSKDPSRVVKFYTLKTISEGIAVTTQPFGDTFACTKDFHHQHLANLLYVIYNNRLYLTVKNDWLSIDKLEQEINQQDYIMPEGLFDDLTTEINKFRERGLQRSYILCGDPGSGKSSFALEMSSRVSGKILKIDSRVFTDLSSSHTRTIIEGLESDFIIVDDIDRIGYSDVAGFLYMLESLKSYRRRPTLLASVNDIEKLELAVIRPGRFDDIIEFSLPNAKERATFISTVLSKHDTKLTQKQLQVIAKETSDMSYAFLKEYCSLYLVDPDFDKVIARIKRRKKYMRLVSDRNQEYIDDSIESLKEAPSNPSDDYDDD